MYLDYWFNHATATGKFIGLSSSPRASLGLRIKRFVDILGALMLLLLLSPIFLVVAALIKLTSPGPLFHIRERIGLNQRPFMMWKFRTMTPGADQQEAALRHLNSGGGPFFKIKNDSRVTYVGRFLRKYSIDELPQLINILNGEMSFVGPRPIFEFELQQFDAWKQLMRFSMKPGLTCFWQVNGRSNSSQVDRMRYDLEYVRQWSLLLDFKLLIKTIPVVLTGDGAV